MDPDKVDAETGNFWRALYKLEKQFSDVPNAQKIAARVSKITYMYNQIGLIFTLFTSLCLYFIKNDQGP